MIEMIHKPFAHQIKAKEHRSNCKASKDGFALLMDMGTGKSYTLLSFIVDEYNSGCVDAALVVAPSQVAHQWVYNQIPDHLRDNEEKMVILWGPHTKKLEKQLHDLLFFKGLSILIMNPEAVITKRGADYVKSFMTKRKVFVGVDESTCIKNHSAKRTKFFIKIAPFAKKRVIMTGTPITNSPMDAFSQFQFVQNGCLGHTNYVSFRNRYALTKTMQVNGRKFETIIGYQRLSELHDKIVAISYRVTKAECVDLPEKIYETREIEMGDRQSAYYKSMKNEMIAILENGDVITAPIVLTQLLRLRQASCNLVPTGDESDCRLIEEKDSRTEEVMNVLDESEGKAIIWATFTKSIEHIAECISKKYGPNKVGFIHGGVNQNSRTEVINQFKNGDISYLVMNPKTSGSGLDLWQANTVIYYNNDWSLDVRLQSEDRAHRIGQKKSVLYVDIVCRGTVDEKIIHALKNKNSLALQITGDNLRKIIGWPA